MKLLSKSFAAIACAALAGLAADCATVPESSPARSERTRAVIGGWFAYSRLAADSLIENFGLPDRVENHYLVWNDAALCKRLTVWNVPPRSGFVVDAIEATVAFPVAQEKRALLAAFSGNLHVGFNGTEISARSHSLNIDFLLLNLAHEILSGVKNPAEARDDYEHAVRLAAAGKLSRPMQGLMFLPKSPQPAFWPLRF